MTALATTVPSASIQAIMDRWSITSFRPLQQCAIEATIQERDLLAVMPTGSGKSLCYQGPAMLRDGLTVVVSPLIALMKDQVESLMAKGIAAAFLNSSQNHHDQVAVEALVPDADIQLLYISPERALQPAFINLLAPLHRKGKLNAIVIDEAHCISQWGHDFRPAYTRLGDLRKVFPGVPMQAYTATATPQVRREIVCNLNLRDPTVLVGEFDRPNLLLRVEHRKNLDQQLLTLIRSTSSTHSTFAGIIYCPRRAETERITEMLRKRGYYAACYHAGLEDAQRESVQNLFMRGDLDIVVATIAFGMGIDRADVRWIAHTVMPPSIERYHQEIGRAGRDGKPAECVIFHSPGDVQMWIDLHDAGQENTIVPLPQHQPTSAFALSLSQMAGYCSGDGLCRHFKLVEHFTAEASAINPAERCQACDTCTENTP